MPGLNTVITPASPDVTIEVTNGGGETGPTAKVQLCVCWDPDVLELEEVYSPKKKDYYHAEKDDGYCIWYGYDIPFKSSLDFGLKFCRKKPDVTFVTGFS